MRKKKFLQLFLLLWLLAGCTHHPPATTFPTISSSLTSTASPTLSPTARPYIVVPVATYAEGVRKRLDLDDRCPHFCWLGINPGVTTAEDARAILSASPRINHDGFGPKENLIETSWGIDSIDISIEKGVVKTISIGLGDFRITASSFMTIFDTAPNEISIRTASLTYECFATSYDLYYPSRKVALTVPYGSWDGPNPYDVVWTLTLNTEFDLSDRQPFRNYGHLQDYLPGQTLPTGPC